MASEKVPKWKRFERLVARIQQTLSPDAEITLNFKVDGQITGTEREVDVAVQQRVGQFNILIAIECKDHKRPLDVKGVEEFIGLTKDIGANKGAIVAANGFTDTAKTRAGAAGINLYRLVDAEQHDWQTYVSIPVVCDFRSLDQWRYRFQADKTTLEWLKEKRALNDLSLFDEKKSPIGTLQQLLRRQWNKQHIPSEPGFYPDVTLRENTMFVMNEDGEYERVHVLADVTVVRKLYFGHLGLDGLKGFQDQITGQLKLPPRIEISTDWIDTREVEQTWLRIPSLDVLAVEPTLVLTASDSYPVAKNSHSRPLCPTSRCT